MEETVSVLTEIFHQGILKTTDKNKAPDKLNLSGVFILEFFHSYISEENFCPMTKEGNMSVRPF